MTDDRVRELERRARETEAPSDRWAWERSLVRSGVDPYVAEVTVYGFASTWLLASHLILASHMKRPGTRVSRSMHFFGTYGSPKTNGCVLILCSGSANPEAAIRGRRMNRPEALRSVWVPVMCYDTGQPERRGPCDDCRLCEACMDLVTLDSSSPSHLGMGRGRSAGRAHLAPEPEIRDTCERLQIVQANRIFEAWRIRRPTVDCLRGHPEDREGGSSFRAEACALCDRSRGRRRMP